MHLALIGGGIVAAVILLWAFIRLTSNTGANHEKPPTTVLSSDTFTKTVLTIIAISTTIIALQGFMK
tara:strand:- start:242 stop:442 length:201 start_codon:yes stop_codon:yes gene_type:complete